MWYACGSHLKHQPRTSGDSGGPQALEGRRKNPDGLWSKEALSSGGWGSQRHGELGWITFPPKFMSTQNLWVWSYWKQNFTDKIESRWGHVGFKWALNICAQTKMSYWDGGRDWMDRYIGKPRTPRMVSRPQKLEEIRARSSLETSERAWPCCQLDCKLPASRTVREYISVAISRPVYGHLLWQH